jgi:hypothetical protein
MVLEDAVVFGTIFSHLSSEDQIPRFLCAYEEIRQGRTTMVRQRDVSNAQFVRMPPGPEQEARDASFRQPRGEWDEGSLKDEFEGLFELFGYDAYDAAEVCFFRYVVSLSIIFIIVTTGMVGIVGTLQRQQAREFSGEQFVVQPAILICVNVYGAFSSTRKEPRS